MCWKKGTVERGDKVVFKLPKGEELVYTTSITCLCQPCRNSQIFSDLGIYNERHDIASVCYGYKTALGDWPSFNEGDYAALARLVALLFTMTKQFKTEKHSIVIDGKTIEISEESFQQLKKALL